MGNNDSKPKSGQERKNSGDKAVEKFAEMMIDRMKAMKASDWRQGWTTGKGTMLGMPQNMSGRNYSGSNSFFLQMDTSMNAYSTPVYLTFLQAQKENIRIKKGAQSMPVIYWDLNIKDERGKRVSESDYRQMGRTEQAKCEVRPFLRAFSVFNVDQTNLAEVNKEKYDAIVDRFKGPQLRDKEGMYENRALDRMFERQEWICPVQNDVLVDGACYSPARDLVILPKKEQFNIGKNAEEIFKDGMEYYSSALHEMTHSTGTPNRLNREKGARFGDAKYAKEELVAELTAAMVGNTLGFDKRILNNNAAYMDGWIKALREEPKFIVSVMADVNKAAKMIIGKIDEQKIALGETPILTENQAKAGVSAAISHGKREWQQPHDIALSAKFDSASIYKRMDGGYAVRASFEGQDLGSKPISRITGIRYEMMPTGEVKDQMLHDTVARKFAGEVREIREQKQQNKENKGLKI
jgi:antirestriction protein ArdC